jgi:hypothetical protein
MPLQNRVTPEGEIIATPHRGLMLGNRGGAFHLPSRTIGHRRWATRHWIACVLEFKGRHRAAMMQPNRYTELFFLDEATALSAGHRPCFECRRRDAEHFAALWGQIRGWPAPARAPEMDEGLHAERVGAQGQKTPRAQLARQPDAPGARPRDAERPPPLKQCSSLSPDTARCRPETARGGGADAALHPPQCCRGYPTLHPFCRGLARRRTHPGGTA